MAGWEEEEEEAEEAEEVKGWPRFDTRLFISLTNTCLVTLFLRSTRGKDAAPSPPPPPQVYTRETFYI